MVIQESSFVSSIQGKMSCQNSSTDEGRADKSATPLVVRDGYWPVKASYMEKPRAHTSEAKLL